MLIEAEIDCTEPYRPVREHHFEFDAAGSRRRSAFARRDAARKNHDMAGRRRDRGLYQARDTQSEADALGSSVLEELGMDRIRHPAIVRFGENTLRTCKRT
ncbi:hypothetical protein [Burkholderia diffusa]|uniref:hypothetical protein n=1 Tax=Burkholderia diffusa TaxID=488732 RepID=UPI000ADC81BA|nr:hypothetical protein [Burkholderia diffusa]